MGIVEREWEAEIVCVGRRVESWLDGAIPAKNRTLIPLVQPLRSSSDGWVGLFPGSVARKGAEDSFSIPQHL